MHYLFIALFIVIFFSFYLKLFLKPTREKITRLKKQQEENEKRRQSLLSQFPDVAKAMLELEDFQQKINKMKGQSVDVEAKLLNARQVPGLLTELVKSSQELSVELQSVKQKLELDREGFSRLQLELSFESNYENAVNYIKKTEEISPYLKIGQIDLAQSKNDPRNLVNVSLRLEAILALTENTQAELPLPSLLEQGEKLKISRSPLKPWLSPASTKKERLKLIGITYRLNGSTAIINDTVVKTGDEIEGQKVESILADSVIINNGIETKTLKIER